MKVNKLALNDSAYPALLRTIASPPSELFYVGTSPADWPERPRVAIVGSRSISAYGRQVTSRLARELAERGICIVSGLALGVDAIAHQAAVEAGGQHIAVLPSGPNRIYPATNHQLGERLLAAGGTLLSEYPPGSTSYKQNFIARNRIVSGLSQAVLITEAGEKSGTLHTARFALEQGREVLAVPGNITSPTSVGTNRLISMGAQLVTCVDDVLKALNLSNLSQTSEVHMGDTPDEQAILDLLYSGVSDGSQLQLASSLSPGTFAQTLTMLELSSKIRPLGGNQWAPR